MERRHEQEWARMAWEGDYTFQEVFLMTNLANSVKISHWCVSTGVPLVYIDDALVATKQQGKTTPAATGMPKPEIPSAPGLSSSPVCPTETPATSSTVSSF